MYHSFTFYLCPGSHCPFVCLVIMHKTRIPCLFNILSLVLLTLFYCLMCWMIQLIFLQSCIYLWFGASLFISFNGLVEWFFRFCCFKFFFNWIIQVPISISCFICLLNLHFCVFSSFLIWPDLSKQCYNLSCTMCRMNFLSNVLTWLILPGPLRIKLFLKMICLYIIMR